VSRRSLATTIAGLLLTLAFAAPASALSAKAPAAGGPLDVQAWPENGTLVVVTALTIPETTQLPVTVRIPVPAGAQIQWAGEVLGGDPAADPGREYKVKKSPAGGQYAEFTVETTRVVQLDSYLPVIKTDGANVSAAFDWIQSVTSPSQTFSIRAPKGATNVVITPKSSGTPETNAAGETLYPGDSLQLKVGSTTPVSLAYTQGSTATAGTITSTSGKSQSLLYFIFATLVVAAGILLVVLVKQRERANAAPEAPERPVRRAKKPDTSAAARSKDKRDCHDDADDDDDGDDWGFVGDDE